MTAKLKGVVAKGMKDRKFLKALLKNPEKTVKDWGLSKTEMKQLKTLVNKTNKVSVKEFNDLFRYGVELGIIPIWKPSKDEPTPPPPWPAWGVELKRKKLGRK